MLKELTIKNFKSYKNEVTFSMEADYDRVNEHKDHVVMVNDNKILKVASMYGPNGGGKSNLLDALKFISDIVVRRRMPIKQTEVKNVFSDDETIEFTIFFIDEKYEYGLNIELLPEIKEEYDRIGRNIYFLEPNIQKEIMVYRKGNEKEFNVLYERNSNGNIISDYFLDLNIFFPNLSKTKCVLSKLFDDYANNDYNHYEQLVIVKRLFLQLNNIINLDNRLSYMIPNYKFIDRNKENIVKYLNGIDIKISNINIYESGKPEVVYFEREIEIDGKKIIKEISFSNESKGTQKVFNLILQIMLGMKNNSIFICDDMNSYLHPKLCAFVIKQFTSQLNINSQLIFNSHDLINMNNEIFRRDEIWFAYRDEEFSSVIVPLSNIVNYKGQPIRNDAKYSKQYLEGKYGSDPFIAKGINWYE